MEDDSKISPNTAREEERPPAMDSGGEIKDSDSVERLARQVLELTAMVHRLSAQDRESSSPTASRSSAELHFGDKSLLGAAGRTSPRNTSQSARTAAAYFAARPRRQTDVEYEEP